MDAVNATEGLETETGKVSRVVGAGKTDGQMEQASRIEIRAEGMSGDIVPRLKKTLSQLKPVERAKMGKVLAELYSSCQE